MMQLFHGSTMTTPLAYVRGSRTEAAGGTGTDLRPMKSVYELATEIVSTYCILD